jgi:hypothetical protein
MLAGERPRQIFLKPRTFERQRGTQSTGIDRADGKTGRTCSDDRGFRNRPGQEKRTEVRGFRNLTARHTARVTPAISATYALLQRCRQRSTFRGIRNLIAQIPWRRSRRHKVHAAAFFVVSGINPQKTRPCYVLPHSFRIFVSCQGFVVSGIWLPRPLIARIPSPIGRGDSGLSPPLSSSCSQHILACIFPVGRPPCAPSYDPLRWAPNRRTYTQA